MPRNVLAIPTSAVEIPDEDCKKRLERARTCLTMLGLDDGAVQQAVKRLSPGTTKTQIEKIVTQLGLTSNSDIANKWIALTNKGGAAHGRLFHYSLETTLLASLRRIQLLFSIGIAPRQRRARLDERVPGCGWGRTGGESVTELEAIDEARIRERAFYLRLPAGQPEGRAEGLWHAAEEAKDDEEDEESFPANDPPSRG